MIPKKIHYCWFGGNSLPKSAQKCIKSWKKYCPDYEIIEWNEKNFDVSSAPLYVRQAYEAKKWAFVSDYARLYALINFGGIYMDTDVEVVSSFDNLLQNKAFAGFEDNSYIATAVMGCEKDFPLFVEFIKYYDDAKFINEDGSYKTITNVEVLTNICLNHGLVQENKYQVIDGFALYTNDYFSPKSFIDGVIRKSVNSVAIHHFDATWFTKEQKQAQTDRWKEKQKKAKKKARRAKIKSVLTKIMGEKLYKKIRG